MRGKRDDVASFGTLLLTATQTLRHYGRTANVDSEAIDVGGLAAFSVHSLLAPPGVPTQRTRLSNVHGK